MNRDQVRQWQYRTLLFEFQKDGLLGDKYIDDEDVEAQLNEQGTRGWELVNVAMIQEGLLAFCKRPAESVAVDMQVQQTVVATGVQEQEPPDSDPEPVSAAMLQQQEREHIQQLERKRRETMSAIDRDGIGGIKIS